MEPLAPGMRRFGAILARMQKADDGPGTALEPGTRQSGKLPEPIAKLMLGSLHKEVTAKDRSILRAHGGIPIRIYTPRRALTTPRAIVLAIHGGGWVTGDLRQGDWIYSTIAHDLDAVAVSVSYRLAPEHPFPAGLEDCYAALEWTAAHAIELGADPQRLGIAGESAGANLAAVVCLLARERNGPKIRHQALIYPVTDGSMDSASYKDNANAIILSAAAMERSYSSYVGTGDRLDWRVSPLHAPSHSGLPPALIQVAGHDPLRDDGIRYAAALKQAQVPVVLTEYQAMPHGFANFPRFARDAKRAMQEVVDQQRVALTAPLTPPADTPMET